jgi:hypothetical protein
MHHNLQVAWLADLVLASPEQSHYAFADLVHPALHVYSSVGLLACAELVVYSSVGLLACAELVVYSSVGLLACDELVVYSSVL